MDADAFLWMLFGVLLIIVRGPLIFAPERTLRSYDGLISTDARVRGLGLALGAFAAACLVLTSDTGASSFWLRGFGGLLGLATFWLLVSPGTYRRLAQGVIGFVRNSIDAAIVRFVGLFAVVLGAWLVYVGIRLL